MPYKDKNKFSEMIYTAVKQTGFPAQLLEKDYYLTVILSKIHDLSGDLVFKGGTCLNKIYYAYYRLSEDLDFSMKLPAYTTTRGNRRKCIGPVKENIQAFAGQFGLRVENEEPAGRNESKQYIFYFIYPSALRPQEMKIKLEISLRFSPVCDIETRDVRHRFLHPFTDEPLFDGGRVNCLSLKEAMSEKLRAAVTRKVIAPRDFYDIDFAIRQGFDLADQEVRDIFVKKLQEDECDPDPEKYRMNLGRSDTEIKEMSARVETELLDVLTPDERKNFNLEEALKRINRAMGKG